MSSHKIALIAGAGPAGLTAAYELLQKTNIIPIVVEADTQVGGISKTLVYKNNRMDIGGHRFFSKNDEVMAWWQEMQSVQGAPSLDEILLNKTNDDLVKGGPDPEKEDKVMLVRQRVSRIFYLRNFFDYPISLKWQTFVNMGFLRTLNAGFGYVWANFFKRKENSLENFYINRFGKPLYKMFFEDYTHKVWGIHPSKLGAEWGSQRVKGLSITAILKDILKKAFVKSNSNINQKEVETSLIEKFIYPKFGPGQLWETCADKIKKSGGQILLETEVIGVNIFEKKVKSVVVRNADGSKEIACDYFFSSMPIKDLINAMKGVEIPQSVQQTAGELPYRDFITVGLLVKKLKIKNRTNIITCENRIPDTWIYIQERDVNVGRLQIFNNWSPYMVNDYKNTMWIGLEYFCNEGDELWNMPSEKFIEMAVDELVKIDIVEREDVLDAMQARIKKAYPTYHGTYYQLDRVRDFLDTTENLYCIGRNGQHRYNNADHSMLTAMVAVDNIVKGVVSKNNIWSVNTEKEYHETKH
ncbi:MAG: NAD(P)/FAD-dependent oxidoreductase [Bacteroidales bacterium]|jgi:protoporphyrinogen oxidase|nr:NAD(P)/FAD-dependent oxidoreductase [Bacteroidales bacterium]